MNRYRESLCPAKNPADLDDGHDAAEKADEKLPDVLRRVGVHVCLRCSALFMDQDSAEWKPFND